LAGDEVARVRVEKWMNENRGSGLIVSKFKSLTTSLTLLCQDPIMVEAVSLGNSSPRLSNAQVIPNDLPKEVSGGRQVQIEATYSDSVSVRLTTSLFFNQPVPAFARLPVSLSLALKTLRATIVIIPPARDDPNPTLTLKLQPDLELSLQSTSLLGSRAKLANVPKIHELIESRVKRALVERGTWKIHLPMKKDHL
jgi:maintenance of mitochondrial morphology protein 1